MVQPNTSKRSKPNSEVAPGASPPLPQIQTIMAVVVPVEIYDQMKRAVRKQPYEDVELLLQTMKNLQPQTVNMQAPPGMA